MCKVVICDLDHKDIAEELAVLSAAGLTTKWLHCTTQQEVIDGCQGAVVLLNQYVRMDRVIFEALPTVKLIVRYGVGYDNVNLQDAEAYGVQVCNVPDYGTCEVADQALAHLMTLTRKTYLSNCLIRAGVWDYQKNIPVFRLGCATVGIFGVGRIGSAFAARVQPLCRRIIAYDPAYRAGDARFPSYIEYVSFEELLAQSDILSIHSPLNSSTYHIFNGDAFAQMKRTAYLINVSRGGIVDEEALYTALSTGRLAGAGLDVVEHEPLAPDAALLSLQNFSISPHTAWYAEESASDLKRKAAEEAVRFLHGEGVKNPLIVSLL